MKNKELIHKKRLAAKSDVDAAIQKHGFDAVRWVINKRSQEHSLRKQLAKERSALNQKIADITRKLRSK